MKSLNLINELYDEILTLNNIKGFKSTENTTDEHLLACALRMLGYTSIMVKHNLSWNAVDEIRSYFKLLKIGPPKPIMRKPLENTIRFDDIAVPKDHPVYNTYTIYQNGDNGNSFTRTVTRHQDANGHWIETISSGTRTSSYTLV